MTNSRAIGLATGNEMDGRFSDTKPSSEDPQRRLVRDVLSADDRDLFISQLGFSVGAAMTNDVATTTLGHHVLGVVLLGAGPQVARVGAWRSVASVENARLLRGQDATVQHVRIDVGGGVSWFSPGAIGEVAVPEAVGCPEPFPAGVRGQAAQDLGPEAGVDLRAVVGPAAQVNTSAGPVAVVGSNAVLSDSRRDDLERVTTHRADTGDLWAGLAPGLEQRRRLLLRHDLPQVCRVVTPRPSQAVRGIPAQYN